MRMADSLQLRAENNNGAQPRLLVTLQHPNQPETSSVERLELAAAQN